MVRMHGRYRMSRHQAGYGNTRMGSSGIEGVSREEVATLIIDAQRALGWTDRGLASKAGITLKMLGKLKAPVGSLSNWTETQKKAWHRIRGTAIARVVTALETAAERRRKRRLPEREEVKTT